MTLQGIDIASYQAGLNTASIPADFIIIKVSQGKNYVNPTWRRQADAAFHAGKLLGLYHYVSGGDAVSEARFFVNNVRPYVGRAVLALDWESNQNGAWGNVAYLEAVAREVIRLTGVRPLLYASASVLGQVNIVSRQTDCGLWIAQYANMSPTGFQAHPWHEGRYTCAVRQYSSNGRIARWNAGLDLDIFYGNRTAWQKYAAANGKVKAAPAPSKPQAIGTLARLVDETLAGKHGNGDARKRSLGRWYNAVQVAINKRLHVNKPAPRPSVTDIARQVIQGKWGNEPQRSARLRRAGYDPAAVQAVVNNLLGVHRAPAARVYTVRAGDNLSTIAARLGTSWQRLAQINHLSNPNRIYPGQRLTY